MEKIYSVAVDGPSGAGKSSLAKAIAAEHRGKAADVVTQAIADKIRQLQLQMEA